MAKSILVLNGHPDPRPERFCAALAEAYGDAARAAGHAVHRIDLGALDTPLLDAAAAFGDPTSAVFRTVQDEILAGDHLVLVFPLWLGMAPAKTKAALEQIYRAGVGFTVRPRGWTSKLQGRSARVIVTLSTPGPFFRLVFGGHGLLALEKSVLWLSGFKPIRRSVVGDVEGIGPKGRARWLAKMRVLGARGV